MHGGGRYIWLKAVPLRIVNCTLSGWGKILNLMLAGRRQAKSCQERKPVAGIERKYDDFKCKGIYNYRSINYRRILA